MCELLSPCKHVTRTTPEGVQSASAMNGSFEGWRLFTVISQTSKLSPRD